MHPRCHGAPRRTARGVHSDQLVARAYIGTSGWNYPGWRKHLYADAPVKRWLEVASRTFDAVEVNGSFYTQIKPETYERWKEQTPDGFKFAVKGHRFVTHYKRLRDCTESVVRLRDQASLLGDKLAAVVWQLPSNFEVDLARLDEFLRALEAWRHVHHALELRHRSWFVPEVAARMREARVAVCMGDAPDFPMWREVTSDCVYVRLHGHTRKYASSYSIPHLEKWAAETQQWLREGRDVHIYFDNDAEGHAVRNAITLRAMLDGTQVPAPPLAAESWRGTIIHRPPPSWGPKRATPTQAVARAAGSPPRARRKAAS